ncbi:isoprenyl transferase [Bombilactobacillus thymidiniphilus]|uniref:Isoprenyl transferase n=1 Tax=Bombilactobacillus thymidiniphilus TaxID=2923363 RepID=A0ABY4PCS2_9LACO|nr:isoprenyl transferase [Bombilactobacillus thymidiniphilus]UQS83492.1 isoprenyl transferase [Bombilactobacillus thymidiniphilus]
MLDQTLPQHVAIIMDGNGRWAAKQGLPRIAGHRKGMNNLKTIASSASDLGIKALTVYAFSTENWARPSSEVKFIMNLPIDFFSKFMPDLIANDVRVLVTGMTEELPEKTREVCQKAVRQTADNQGMILNFAFNYGARSDILNAVKSFSRQAIDNPQAIDELSERDFGTYLRTAQLGSLQNPDLLIRTGGEKRLSNFYLWELAYSELVFVDEYWPDYSPDNLQRDLAIFRQRERRYGKIIDEQ